MNTGITKYYQSLQRPVHVAFLLMMFLFQDSHEQSDYMKYFYLGGVLFLLNITRIINRLKTLTKENNYIFAYIAFALYATLALFYGPSIQIPAYKMFVFGTAMYFVYLSVLDTHQSIIKFIENFWISGCIMCVYFVLNYGTAASGRTIVLGMNVINAGIIAAFTIVFSLYLCNGLSKLFYLIQIPLGIFVVILSGSKSALTFLCLLILVFVLCRIQSKISRFFFLVVFIISLFLAYHFIIKNEFLYSVLGYRLEGFSQTISGEAGGEDESRFIMIKDAFAMFKSNPVLGIGFDCYRVESKYTETWSHCNYTEILACFGLIGFIIYYSRFYCFYIFFKKHLSHANDSESTKEPCDLAQTRKELTSKSDKNISALDCKLCLSIVVALLVNDIMVVNYYTAVYQIIFAFLSAECILIAKNNPSQTEGKI